MNGLSLQDLYPATYHSDVRAYNPMTQRMDQFDPALEAEIRRRTPDWRVVRGYPGGIVGLSCKNIPVDPLAVKLAQLSPSTQKEVARRAIEWGVQRGVSDWIEMSRRAGGMGMLGQDVLSSAVSIAVQNALIPLMPTLKAQLLEIAEPAAKKASEVVGPVIEEKLREYGPTLAAITGIVAAVLSVVGMLLVGGYLAKQLR